ncbi:LysR family transcriptional regulator [Williamsia sterculiae]|uniref:Transcriptional regulator, LysR family n=1 Tax=Williamsia sterculiae TaxID=1344003 RepID=A0A1N7H8M7_9NOCA|nr:LysR family transcriptional regulator [Williamsia sterculiae]SIS21235.1 transcriptional regulator, LysR family [Williamsia sterculiae]
MELRQLEYFVAVATDLSFTAAAQRTYTTQPNISAQMRALEREWGTPLFDRVGRTVTLTSAGRAALPHARAALDQAGAAAQAVADVQQVLRGSLAVGMVDGCTIGALFAAMGDFRRAHPGVDLSLSEDESPRLADRVRTGDLDIALVGSAARPPAGLAEFTVISEPIVVVVPRGHRLAAASAATVDDLRDEPIVALPVGAGIRTVFDRATGGLPVAMAATSPAAVAELVIGGLGIGVLSASIAAAHTSTLRALPLVGADDPALLSLVWRADPTAATAAFVDVARRRFGRATDRPA